ncbi:MAG TPA: arginine deiminase family protein [Pyrinomonadaceae bacterium]|nr:arginine deiminase family protein [Pyrinomonadaceae bacterium]
MRYFRTNSELTRAIIRSPSRNFAAGLTSSGLPAPDHQLTVKQHDHYCLALENLGLRLIRLPADERHPDSTFVEDTAILTKRVAVITRPGAPSRRSEVDDITQTLNQFYSSVQTITGPGTLDGGDVCQVGDHFFVGVSARTNQDGATQLSEILRRAGYSCTSIDIQDLSPRLLHLKSGLAYLGGNNLVVDSELFDRAEFQEFDRICPDPDEAYAANCLAFGNTILIAAGYPRFEAQLRLVGFNTVTLNMSEFQKMDGGLSCLSLRF